MSTEAVKAQEKSAKAESKPLAKKIYDGIEWLTSSLTYISILAVLLIIALTVIDVVGRKFFGSPLAGTVGMVQLLMVVVIYMVVGYTTIKNGHVVVDVITGKLPKKGQNYLIFVCTLICFAFAALMTWRTAVLVGSYAAMNSYDKTTLLPLAPFVALVSIGCGLMTLAFFASLTVYFTDSGKNIRQVLTKVIPGVAIMLLLGALLIWAKELPEMGAIATAITGFAFMLILMFVGVPVALTLAISGVIGMSYTRGLAPALNILAEASFRTVSSYVFSVLIMFMSMGYIAFYSGFGKDLYELAYKWVGRLRGGLAQATVAASALFGAIVGDSTAGVATFGTIALPEMRKRHYDLSLSCASIAVGAILCELIPPSLTFILWGVLTETNVGDLFMAGIIPGIILMTMLMGYIYIRCRLNPNMGPPGPPTTWGEKFKSLSMSLPAILIFLLVMGGLYGGVFTPTEAGGIGAFGILVLGLVMRRLGFKSTLESLKQTTKVVAMCFFVLIGAQIFGSFLATTKVPTQLAATMLSLDISPIWIVVATLILWFALGFIMPALGILLLFTPLVLPMLRAFGFDLVWCGVIFCFAIHLGTVTPPVAINAFVLKGVAPDVPLSTIFKGIMPMVVLLLIALALFVAFPQLSLFLPNLLR